jgi:hypothetical protein
MSLQTDGSGTLSWVDTATSDFGLFDQVAGVLYPKNSTVDLLIGGTSTSHPAKFAFINVDSGIPTASIAGTMVIMLYLTGAGNLATTNMQNLTLGGSTTGQVSLINSGDRIN